MLDDCQLDMLLLKGYELNVGDVKTRISIFIQ